MKKYEVYFLAFVSCSFLLTSCMKDETKPVNYGEANFKTYVAFGGMMTAGYADNALYYNGQMVSYPNLLSKQFALVGGGAFRQPLVPSSSVGAGVTQNSSGISVHSRLVLEVVDGSLTPVSLVPQGDASLFNLDIYSSQGAFNNMGVPGATVPLSLYKGYGNFSNLIGGKFNPYFFRMASNDDTASMLGDAIAQNPTFFTILIGCQDVWGYALAGGVGVPITPTSGAAGSGFDASYEQIINSLTANGAKGAVANIPYIKNLAFFTTIPYNSLTLTSQVEVNQLNSEYATQIAAGTISTFHLGVNAFVIADSNVAGGARQIKSDEYILLTTPLDSLKADWGSTKPIPDEYTLNETEINNINTATDAYNQEILSEANAKGLAYVDLAGFLKKINNGGVMVNGRKVTSTFVTGGFYSLDGLNPTPLGNAMVANLFIGAINAKYDASIPLVDPTHYGSVVFPN